METVYFKKEWEIILVCKKTSSCSMQNSINSDSGLSLRNRANTYLARAAGSASHLKMIRKLLMAIIKHEKITPKKKILHWSHFSSKPCAQSLWCFYNHCCVTTLRYDNKPENHLNYLTEQCTFYTCNNEKYLILHELAELAKEQERENRENSSQSNE